MTVSMSGQPSSRQTLSVSYTHLDVYKRQGRERPRIAGRPSAINGLSWYCDARGQRCHYTGSLNAFHALVHWDRDRRESVAFVSNSALPPWQTISLQRDLVAALAGRPAAAVDTGVQGLKRIERAARPSLAGRFEVGALGTLKLSVGGPALQLQLEDVYKRQPLHRKLGVYETHAAAFTGPPAGV